MQKVELKAMTYCIHKLLPINIFLSDLCIKCEEPMKLYVSDKLAMKCAHNTLCNMIETKHVEVGQNFIKEKLQMG